MKLSEYLWKRVQFDTAAPADWAPEKVQGEFRVAMEQAGDTTIISDRTGAILHESDANEVYGQHIHKLNEAYKLGYKSLFELIVMKDQIDKEAWKKAKEEAEKKAQENAAEG